MKKTSLCLALGAVCALASTVATAAGVDAGWKTTATHAHVSAAAVNTSDLLPFNLPIQVQVALKLQNRASLDHFIAAAHNPASPLFQTKLQSAAVAANFLPSQAQAQAVADYLSRAGFTNVSISANRLLVSADGTAGNARAAFGTRLVKATDANGRAAYANIDDAKVPAALADFVLAVSGLQTVTHPHTMLARASNKGGAGSGRPGSGGTVSMVGHNPTTFPTIYNVGGTPAASTITVGIISDGDMTQPLKDLTSFTTANHLPAVNTQVVTVGAPGTDTSGTPEWDLDSQNIVGMSGGVGKLIFYAANSLSNSALTAAFNQVVSDNQAQVINVSLGECETSAFQDGSMAADDQILALGAAQGQTFSISTGDSGSNECSKKPTGTTPSYPASSPYVVAVSGTSLVTDGSGNWLGETLWSGAGGSPSTVEPKPSWQTQGGGTTRDVADVAFDADPNSGAIIIVNGSNAQYGGTSLSAPLFAAIWARMLAAHPGLGFAAPHLYTVSTASYHDVTSGSNGGETATVGWDYASGFGSGIVSALNAGL
ncbi:MAG TPA: S53 family peptidase [Rhodanobacter sp.]|nr:S53 family peptidase [Rhodanobacter sp.]